MRGEASRISDRVSRDELAPKLRSTGKDAWRIGNELFTITNVLDHTVQLERALTDPSRPVDDKIGVLKELIGAQAHPMTLEIMSDLSVANGAVPRTSPTPSKTSALTP